MDPNTGRLMRLEDGAVLPANYERVPAELERAAARVLGAEQEAQVSLTSGGKLSNWARDRRKAKAKAKIAAASKRRNRS